MRRVVVGLVVAVCTCASVSCAEEQPAAAAPGGAKPALTGELSISDTTEKQKDPQQEGAKEVLAWAETLESVVHDSGKGELPTVEKNGSDYLAAVYLFCTLRNGPCPFVLESILEGEVVDARTHESVRCSVMSRFWKSWLSMDMEERSKFSDSVSRGLEMARFNSQQRGRFVACKDSVNGILASQDQLSRRYGKDGSSVESVSKLVGLLREVRDSKIDLYATTGIRDSKN